MVFFNVIAPLLQGSCKPRGDFRGFFFFNIAPLLLGTYEPKGDFRGFFLLKLHHACNVPTNEEVTLEVFFYRNCTMVAGFRRT